MKKATQIVMLSFLIITLTANEGKAKVVFNNDKLQEEITSLFEKYEKVKQLYTTLDSSSFTYVFQYGQTTGHVEGIFEYNGMDLTITFERDGNYSLQSRFVHEATHALQFEQGKIGFVRKGNSEWKAVNIDIWDEAEAFNAMIPVAVGSDFYDENGENSPTGLQQFKRKIEIAGFDKAARWLGTIYTNISPQPQNNPMTSFEIFNATWAKKRGMEFYYHPYKS